MFIMEEDEFLAWEAVVAREQGLRLTKKQQAAMEELVDFSDGEEDRVLYINEVPRPSEPWHVILNEIVSHLPTEPFEVSDRHYAEECEGWGDLVACLEEHAGGLALPAGAASPVEVVPLELRHKLWLQSCFDDLSGLGENDELTLENPDEHYRVDDFVESLREHKDSVEYFNLTLDSLLERMILPERDKPIFVRLMQEKLGMKSTTERIADHL
jgi:hypothetical protein